MRKIIGDYVYTFKGATTNRQIAQNRARKLRRSGYIVRTVIRHGSNITRYGIWARRRKGEKSRVTSLF